MSLIETTRPRLVPVTFDLYRDIHKGIRAELFTITSSAGSLDPADQGARERLAGRVRRLVDLLVTHAEHEDGAIQPVLEQQLPDLAEQVATDHETLEARVQGLAVMADECVNEAEQHQRVAGHVLYLELASFTSAYLAHQDLEERVLMPAIERAVGVDEVIAIHQAIIGSMPPAELVPGLVAMIPAMNVDDRTELLAGIRMSGPPEAFDGVWELTGSLLDATDLAALRARLGLA
ncbi:MAG TPA: hemerythrin domain-containing protein [Acidimicrobiales bacterium]|jgi:hemerythrin-like domain-containing protein|nr:hemerythrin domain-containing protein [Acidimicrobiales bacterium]